MWLHVHVEYASPISLNSDSLGKTNQNINITISLTGGGDGALLYELLKENPKYVWMLEIDDLVMKACNKHLKSICGDVLERRKGPNFEVNMSLYI